MINVCSTRLKYGRRDFFTSKTPGLPHLARHLDKVLVDPGDLFSAVNPYNLRECREPRFGQLSTRFCIEDQNRFWLVSIDSWLGNLDLIAVVDALTYRDSAYHLGTPGVAVSG